MAASIADFWAFPPICSSCRRSLNSAIFVRRVATIFSAIFPRQLSSAITRYAFGKAKSRYGPFQRWDVRHPSARRPWTYSPPHTRQGWKALHHKPLNCASMTDRRIRPVGPEVRVQFPLVCRRPPTQGRNTLFQLPATNLGIAAYQLAVTVLPKTDLACAQS
jgi:hypothetical protein